MSAITDIELLDHLAGRLPAERAEAIERALVDSPEVRERYERLKRMYDLLGEAEAMVDDRDLWPLIAARLAERSDEERAAVIGRIGGWSRVAAAVLLAAGLGHVAGLLTLAGSTAPGDAMDSPSAEVADVDETDVVDELGFAALGTGAVGSFAEAMLNDTSNDEDAS